jgi:hypothetical protein
VLLDDIEFFLDDLVGHVELVAAAVLADRGAKEVSVEGEVLGQGLASRGASLALGGLCFVGKSRGSRSGVEGGLGLCRDDRRGSLRLVGRGLFALAKGNSEEFGDAVVELGQIAGELGVGREQLGHLRKQRGVLLLQALELGDHATKTARFGRRVDRS